MKGTVTKYDDNSFVFRLDREAAHRILALLGSGSSVITDEEEGNLYHRLEEQLYQGRTQTEFMREKVTCSKAPKEYVAVPRLYFVPWTFRTGTQNDR